MTTHYARLAGRKILRVGGEQAADFLQGLVSNDVTEARGDRAVFAALLTPQGKFLHDFFITEGPEGLVLETDGARLEDLKKRLTLYRLRSKVALEAAGDDQTVWAVWGDEADKAADLPVGTAYADPRLAALGTRIIATGDPTAALEGAGFQAATEDDHGLWRLRLGVPEGASDLKAESSGLLESNYDALNAISWTKGCYMGQELTARTHYRGLVKRRLVAIAYDGEAPAAGADLLSDGKTAGEVRSARGGAGIASLKLSMLNDQGTAILATQEGQQVTARLPDYLPAE